jgi:hypothetical protein
MEGEAAYCVWAEREREKERAKKARIIYNCLYIIQDTKRAQGPRARSKTAVTIK